MTKTVHRKDSFGSTSGCIKGWNARVPPALPWFLLLPGQKVKWEAKRRKKKGKKKKREKRKKEKVRIKNKEKKKQYTLNKKPDQDGSVAQIDLNTGDGRLHRPSGCLHIIQVGIHRMPSGYRGACILRACVRPLLHTDLNYFVSFSTISHLPPGRIYPILTRGIGGACR